MHGLVLDGQLESKETGPVAGLSWFPVRRVAVVRQCFGRLKGNFFEGSGAFFLCELWVGILLSGNPLRGFSIPGIHPLGYRVRIS